MNKSGADNLETTSSMMASFSRHRYRSSSKKSQQKRKREGGIYKVILDQGSNKSGRESPNKKNREVVHGGGHQVIRVIN